MLVRWENRFSVGEEVIDEQHKTLIGIINNLHAALLDGEGKAKVFVILQELASYSMVHFKTEEQLMAKTDFYDLENHKKEHEKFKHDIASFIIKHQAGDVLVAKDVLTFLHEWLIYHITEVDQKYKPYLKKLSQA